LFISLLYNRISKVVLLIMMPPRRTLFESGVLCLLLLLAQSTNAQGWKLIWSDEFNGSKNSPSSSKNWTAETGGGGWGNRELEYYTADRENSYQDGSGSLVIKATQLKQPDNLSCWYGPCRFTSARLTTKNKFQLIYGRVEARIKVPVGEGVWPAFWLLGSNISEMGWPACGEIDVMENIGREPSTVHGTIHGPGYSGGNGIGMPFNLSGDKRFADDFHVFALEVEPEIIRWYVDDVLYETRTPADLPKGTKWVYDHPFFIILNLAIGGNWPGGPDATTKFPQSMLVDYVRVYQLSK
jgi:beta-glucanase (GH16 family)